MRQMTLRTMRRTMQGAALAAVLMASNAEAITAADSLPYPDTPDWSDIIFQSASMTVAGGVSTLTTNYGVGVWFGNYSAYNPPSWSIANNVQGNYLSLTARFSPGADDWSAYMSDGTRYAAMIFNPTGCDSNVQSCYLFPGRPGVDLYFGGATPGSGYSQFVELDTTQYATYEWLLLGDTVTYRINGQSYSDTAILNNVQELLIIGDGSATNLTGTGAMQISSVSFDTAPDFAVLPSMVPEPDSWAMLITGFGLIGATLRRRRALFCLKPGARHGQSGARTRSSAG